MPLRSTPSPLAFRLRRLFHSSAFRRADGTNHYETLRIPTDATPSEVKKSFYSLSKSHHPDRNPDDPNAAARFVKISEAYAILGTPAKRHQYDRDFLRSGHAHGHSHAHHPAGSYHSSGPVGGRPASGLSRRRTQFRGPPPSFYRSGGWGAHGEKRQAAQGNRAPGTAGPGAEGDARPGSMGGGMGPGQQPYGRMNDVPHFDREAHYRTQENHDKRRKKRISEHDIPVGPNRGMLANFLFVSGIVSFGVFVPSYLFEKMTRKNKPGT